MPFWIGIYLIAMVVGTIIGCIMGSFNDRTPTTVDEDIEQAMDVYIQENEIDD